MKIEDDVWEAERLLRRRRRNGHCEYLVKWRSYPLRESTWEPEENILDTGLLAHFNYELKTRGLVPLRGRPRKRTNSSRAPPLPAKRPRRTSLPPAASFSPGPSSHSRGRPRGRPRLQPLSGPVRERNRNSRTEQDGSEEWLPDSEDEEENVEDMVEEDDEEEEDEEERENLGRPRRRSSRLRRMPLRRRPLVATVPGQGALSGLKRHDLLLTDVTWDGITVTIKEDISVATSAPAKVANN